MAQKAQLNVTFTISYFELSLVENDGMIWFKMCFPRQSHFTGDLRVEKWLVVTANSSSHITVG